MLSSRYFRSLFCERNIATHFIQYRQKISVKQHTRGNQHFIFLVNDAEKYDQQMRDKLINFLEIPKELHFLKKVYILVENNVKEELEKNKNSSKNLLTDLEQRKIQKKIRNSFPEIYLFSEPMTKSIEASPFQRFIIQANEVPALLITRIYDRLLPSINLNDILPVFNRMISESSTISNHYYFVNADNLENLKLFNETMETLLLGDNPNDNNNTTTTKPMQFQFKQIVGMDTEWNGWIPIPSMKTSLLQLATFYGNFLVDIDNLFGNQNNLILLRNEEQRSEIFRFHSNLLKFWESEKIWKVSGGFFPQEMYQILRQYQSSYPYLQDFYHSHRKEMIDYTLIKFAHFLDITNLYQRLFQLVENEKLLLESLPIVVGRFKASKYLSWVDPEAFPLPVTHRDQQQQKEEEEGQEQQRAQITVIQDITQSFYHHLQQFTSKQQQSIGLNKAMMISFLFSVKKPKNVQLSCWDQRPLSEKQLTYAALDSWIYLLCGIKLCQDLDFWKTGQYADLNDLLVSIEDKQEVRHLKTARTKNGVLVYENRLKPRQSPENLVASLINQSSEREREKEEGTDLQETDLKNQPEPKEQRNVD